MKTIALIMIGLLCSSLATADDHSPWEPGTYWTATSVEAKPGRLEDYVADLKQYYRKSLDQQTKDGMVASYTMFVNVHPRHGEGDLILMVEWKSGEKLLDTPEEYFTARAKKMFGSEDAAQAANIDRGELRTILSTTLLREFDFSK